MAYPALNRFGRSCLPHHFHQRNPGGVTALYFLQKSHSPAVHPVAGLKPKMEAQTIDSRHGGFIGGFASKSAGNQTECISVISIHVLDDSRRSFSDRVG